MTPNEYFSLAMILQKKPLQDRMKRDLYRKYLIINDWIDFDDKPTDKVRNSRILDDFMDEEFTKNVETYRLMWPPITLPSGKTARSSSIDLEKRFKWFFSNYNFSWEAVFRATEKYIEYYRDRSFAYMRSSAFFIYKEESTKIRTSTLADWCDNLEDGAQIEDFHIDV